MVYYADISEVWNTTYKIPKVKDRFRNDTYLWEDTPKKEVVPVMVEPEAVVPEPAHQVIEETYPNSGKLHEPAINQDGSISSQYLNITLKKNNVCERLKEYSDEYKASYIESLIEEDMKSSDKEEYYLLFKILAVVLIIELFKLLVSPLIRRG